MNNIENKALLRLLWMRWWLLQLTGQCALHLHSLQLHRQSFHPWPKMLSNNNKWTEQILPLHTPLTLFIRFSLPEQKCCMRAVGLCVNTWGLYLISVLLEKSYKKKQESCLGICHFNTNGHKCLSRLILIFVLPFSLIEIKVSQVPDGL